MKNYETDEITLHEHESADAFPPDISISSLITITNTASTSLILKTHLITLINKSLLAPIVKTHQSQERRTRWEKLNILIASTEKALKEKTPKQGKITGKLPFSKIKLGDVGDAFPMNRFVQESLPIPEHELIHLHETLKKWKDVTKSLVSLPNSQSIFL